MRVGIITYHRAINYGSVLQAYALCEYLRERNICAEIIDYHTSGQDELYSYFEKNNSVMSIARNCQSLAYIRAIKKKEEKFKNFLLQNVKLSAKSFNEKSDLSGLNKEYDLFICGSDQIWNSNCADFSSAYLLDFVDDKGKCLSYAPSFGVSSIPGELHGLLRENVKDFRALSVREESGALELADLVERNVSFVPDPVFLPDEEKWTKLMPGRLVKDKYIFCYFIGDVQGMRDFAVRMHKLTGYKLVVVNKNIRDELYKNKKMYSAGPAEFLSLIYNSEFVICNSFHAVSFSLIFEKNFWVFESTGEGSSRSRIDCLLEKVNLTDRILNAEKNMPENIVAAIDYSEPKRLLSELKTAGTQYIEENVSETER